MEVLRFWSKRSKYRPEILEDDLEKSAKPTAMKDSDVKIEESSTK